MRCDAFFFSPTSGHVQTSWQCSEPRGGGGEAHDMGALSVCDEVSGNKTGLVRQPKML